MWHETHEKFLHLVKRLLLIIIIIISEGRNEKLTPKQNIYEQFI